MQHAKWQPPRSREKQTMNGAPFRSIARSVALSAAVVCSQPGEAASAILNLTDLEPQYASQLCWAAADVIVANSVFKSTCATASVPGRSSQAFAAALNESRLGIGTPASNPGRCETHIQTCNHLGTPQLTGLSYKTGASTTGLSWSAATAQIDGGHPFLFQWNYPSSDDPTQPEGLHVLVAIGYSDETGTRQLTIWDPWPVPDTLPQKVPACGPATATFDPALHTMTIDFSTYGNPQSDMGVAAVHANDQFFAGSRPQAPPDVHVSGLTAPGRGPAGGSGHNRLTLAAAVRNVSEEGGQTSAPITRASVNTGRLAGRSRVVGIPFRIVGLTLADLRRGRQNPDALLIQKTAAMLYPVESNGEVVDSYLELLRDGRWRRGGYSNNAIAKLLVQSRSRYAAEHHLNVKDFYLLSVPGRAAFFVGFGVGSKAVLIPASSDPSIGAVAGVAVPAARQLRQLVAAIDKDDALPPYRGRPPQR